MGCQGLRNNFTAYLDGGLDRSEREAIDRHVRTCAGCRRDLETLRQTVDLLHSPLLPVEDAPDHVRELLARKIVAVRQPLSWRDRVFFWRVEGRPRQVIAWGYGMAASALLFLGAAAGLGRLAVPGVQLGVGIPDRGKPAIAAAGPTQTPVRPAPASTPSTALPKESPIRWWPEGSARVGRATAVYLFVDMGRDIADAEVRVYPAAGVTMLSQAVPQEDASYLIHRGPLMRGSQQARMLTVEVRPTREGTHTLRVAVRESGRTIAEAPVSLTAAAAGE